MDDTRPPDEPEEDGLLSDDKHIRRDCRLIARFPVKAALRQSILDKLEDIAIGKKVNSTGQTVDKYRAREQLSAIRTLSDLVKINMEDERRVLLSGSPPEKNVIQIASEQAIAMDLTILPPGEVPAHMHKHSGNGNGNRNGKR